MTVYDENLRFEELRAKTGMGSALYAKLPAFSGKFGLIFPMEKVPSPSGDIESVEIDVTTSTTKTKIDGKETLNDMEFEVFAHRDNLDKLEEMNRKTYEFITANHDFTGERFFGTVTYKSGERTSGDPSKCTVKVTPTSKPVYIRNILPLLIPTAKFGAIESMITLSSKTATAELDITTDPVEATITAKSENVGTCTATITGKKLTITGVAEGSTIVSLETKLANHASMKRTILVQVPSDPAPTV